MKVSLIVVLVMAFFQNSFAQDKLFEVDSVKYGAGKIYHRPDEYAQFPGGHERMNEFFSTNFDAYAESSGAMGMEGAKEGMVEALFIVETNGKVKYIEITKPFTNLYDEQMENTLRRMPKWQPANVNGVPVRSFSTYTYALKFFLR